MPRSQGSAPYNLPLHTSKSANEHSTMVDKPFVSVRKWIKWGVSISSTYIISPYTIFIGATCWRKHRVLFISAFVEPRLKQWQHTCPNIKCKILRRRPRISTQLFRWNFPPHGNSPPNLPPRVGFRWHSGKYTCHPQRCDEILREAIAYGMDALGW